MKKILLIVFLFSLPAAAQFDPPDVHKIPTTIKEFYKGEILFDTAPSSGRVEGKWTQGQNMPFPRYYGASVMYERNDSTWLYVFGGDTTGGGVATRACLRYNVDGNLWQYISPLPTPMRVNAAARIGDKIYTMGGFDAPFPNLEITKFYEYDVIKDSWEEFPDLPERVFFHKAFAHQDSLIYILGGMKTATRDIPRNRVDLFNTIRRTFQEATPLTEPVAEFGLSKKDNRFFIAGGIVNARELTVTDQTVQGTINSGNPKIIDYENKQSYPHSIRSLYAYFFSDVLIIYLAGLTTLGLTPISSAFYFNILQNIYAQGTNTPYPAGAFHSGYSFKQSRGETEIITVVMAGGVTTGPAITGQTWVYRDTVLITDINEKDKLPSDIHLGQNYPNPFNPSTKIQFALPKESFTRLEIFNALGEKVSTLVSETLSAGTYDYEWNAGSLSSGIYFYRLKTEKFSEIKKMILLH